MLYYFSVCLYNLVCISHLSTLSFRLDPFQVLDCCMWLLYVCMVCWWQSCWVGQVHRELDHASRLISKLP